MTHQYKKLPVTMKMWMQFNVMPRTRSDEDMKLAISAVHQGVLSQRKASVTYSIPRATFQLRVNGKRDIKPKLGRKPAVTAEDKTK